MTQSILPTYRHDILKKISFSLLGAVAALLAAATVAGHISSPDSPLHDLYRSPWLLTIWLLLAVSAAAYVTLRRKSMSAPALLLHLSLLLILAGAAITHFLGKEGKITLHTGKAAVASFTLSSGETAPLPFSIAADQTGITCYPGTSTPSDFFSLITVSRQGETRKIRISMNKIASVDGYRFYQTAMSGDSTTLSISHDPCGIPVTYAGYAMLLLSMLLFPFSRKSRLRALICRKETILPAIILLLSSSPIYAASSTTDPSGIPPAIPANLARNFGKLLVFHGDRVMPLETMARDFCIKVYGKESYKGLTPEQVLTGWLFYYDDWKHQPMIKTQGATARSLTAGRSHAALKDFYHRGNYLLEDAMRADLTDRRLADTDARIGLVSSVCTGAAFRLFPADNGDATEWYSWTDNIPTLATDSLNPLPASVMEHMARAIAHRQWKDADDQLNIIHRYQERCDNLPSQSRITVEHLYNRFGSPLPPAVAALLAGLLLMMPFMTTKKQSGTWRAAVTAFETLLTVWLAAILTARGIIGSHLPLSNGYETMLLMALLGSLTALVAGRRSWSVNGAALIVSGLAAMVAVMGRDGATVSLLMPVLASPLLSVHVLLVMASYTLFTLMAVNSIAALCSGNPHRSTEYARISTIMLYPAIFMLAAGIFIGAVWANQSWGRYWGWDPKETWALITMIIYSFPLHSGSLPIFRRARTLHIYYLMAIGSVAVTYFGVNHLLGGLHSYA